MTTPWQPSGEWAGATVAVLAAGPSMTAAVAEAVRAQADRVIVVNNAIRFAPDADMLVALDAGWPQEWRDFGGMLVTGIEDPDLDALYVGHRFERVQMGPSHEIEIRNSGLTAVRLAAELGAARIIRAGFDATAEDGFPYDGVALGLRAIERELRARGIVVEPYLPDGYAGALADMLPKVVAACAEAVNGADSDG